MPSAIHRPIMNPIFRPQAKTAASIAAELKPLTRGMTMSVGSSEGDQPVKTVVSTGKFPGHITAASLSKFLKLTSTTKLSGQSASKFLKEAVAQLREFAADPKNAPADKARWTKEADKMDKLAKALMGLSDLQMFQDTNEDHVVGKVFIVGKAPDGKLVGVQTGRVWT